MEIKLLGGMVLYSVEFFYFSMKVRVVRESEVEVDCTACTRTSGRGRPLRGLHPQDRVLERACETCILKSESEQGLEPEAISFEALPGPQPRGFIGEDASYASGQAERRGAHTPAAERYDLSEVYGDDLLLRFKLAPTVFDLDDAALQEKIDIITGHWPQVGDRDLCELIFSDFDLQVRSEWDRERYLKVQAMRRRGGSGPRAPAVVVRERLDEHEPDDPVEMLRRNQQEFSG